MTTITPPNIYEMQVFDEMIGQNGSRDGRDRVFQHSTINNQQSTLNIQHVESTTHLHTPTTI